MMELRQLPDLIVVTSDAETLTENTKTLLDDMPYHKEVYERLNTICNQFDCVMKILESEQERLLELK